MAREKYRGRSRTATTPEEREMQLANAAYDLAEEQIASGTASSQVITHFLKMGSTRERVEQERLRGEIELQKVKAEQLEGQKRMEEMFTNALDAFRGYSGLPVGHDADGDAFEER